MPNTTSHISLATETGSTFTAPPAVGEHVTALSSSPSKLRATGAPPTSCPFKRLCSGDLIGVEVVEETVAVEGFGFGTAAATQGFSFFKVLVGAIFTALEGVATGFAHTGAPPPR